MSRRVVVIGGVAGGMSAAARLARLESDARITVLESSGHVSYANCGLPYYVGGAIEDEEQLLLSDPVSLGQRFGLDVRVNSTATHIDRQSKTVSVVGPEGQYQLDYDQLVLSPGARAIRPNIPGSERLLTIQRVEEAVVARAATEGATSAVVIGGGFIGLEMAENLVARGVRVSLIEAADEVLGALDAEMAVNVRWELEMMGVDVRVGTSVTSVDESGATLSDGTRIPAQLVVAAIGVRANSELAAECGLAIGRHGGIVIDENGRTSDESIFAVGDAVEKTDGLSGEASMVYLANVANRQGRRVADAICGLVSPGVGALGTAIVKVFGLSAATVGWNERRLRVAGREFLAIHTHPANHAGYYPGAMGMSLKLLISPQGEILGAQGVGYDGVDKRIDVLATAMRGGIPAGDLADLELAYAPPFGSAKDPVNMLGWIAQNRLSERDHAIQWHEVEARRAGGATLLDVRSPEEFAAGAIPGSVNIPVDELIERIDEVDEQVVVICQAGQRAHVAARRLADSGRRVSNLDGGWRTWMAGHSTTSVAAAAR